MSLLVSEFSNLELLLKPCPLLGWVVQFRIPIRNLHARNVELEALDGFRIIGPGLCEWRNLGGIVVDECRLDQVRLGHSLKQRPQQLAAPVPWLAGNVHSSQ